MKGYVVVFILVLMVLQCADAVDPVIAGGSRLYPDSIEFNARGVDISNTTIPPQYIATPTLVDMNVEVSAHSFPGPKGEMAAGPRRIGFTTDPGSLLIIIIGIISVSAGFLFLKERRQEEPGDDDAGETDESREME